MIRATEHLVPAELSALERYQLMTSLVVPRPIGWLSTRSDDGILNLAPYSYFGALSVSPMLVAVSIGHKKEGLKDSLVNLRRRGAFCMNVVSEELLEPMNESSASVPPNVDEFVLTGLTAVDSDCVDAPFVALARAVLECEGQQEVDLRGAPNTLVIGEVIGIRLDPSLESEKGTRLILPEDLKPVGRLGGAAYSVVDEVQRVLRPDRR